MAIEPINAVLRPVKVAAVKRVARRAASESTEEVPEEAQTPKRSNPPGVGENLDVTV